MGTMKRLLEEQGRGSRNVYQIKDNQFIGHRVSVTWLKPWGKKPVGYTAEGELLATFVVNGRTLIGELKVPSVRGSGWTKLSCPWSKKWLQVTVLD